MTPSDEPEVGHSVLTGLFKKQAERCRALSEIELQKRRDLAAAYVRVFEHTPDGARVLADIRKHFPLFTEVFTPLPDGEPYRPFDPIAAAIKDGERNVARHIEAALVLGAQNRALPTP